MELMPTRLQMPIHSRPKDGSFSTTGSMAVFVVKRLVIAGGFLHRTPTHVWWLNQLECWLPIPTRRFLHPADFADTTDVSSAILGCIDPYNDRVKPSSWSYETTEKAAA